MLYSCQAEVCQDVLLIHSHHRLWYSFCDILSIFLSLFNVIFGGLLIEVQIYFLNPCYCESTRFIFFCMLGLVMFNQNVITGPSGENDRWISRFPDARFLRSFSLLKLCPYKLAFICLQFWVQRPHLHNQQLMYRTKPILSFSIICYTHMFVTICKKRSVTASQS